MRRVSRPSPIPALAHSALTVNAECANGEGVVGGRDRARLCAVRYLSLDWIDALTREVAQSHELAALAADHTIGVTQVVTDGPEGDVTYHLQVGAGTAAFGAGGSEPEDVRIQEDWETAVAVATGSLNAQEAFIKGRILLTGDQQKLMDSAPVFSALDAIFSKVRADTDYS
jgi:hypothetical protein